MAQLLRDDRTSLPSLLACPRHGLAATPISTLANTTASRFVITCSMQWWTTVYAHGGRALGLGNNAGAHQPLVGCVYGWPPIDTFHELSTQRSDYSEAMLL